MPQKIPKFLNFEGPWAPLNITIFQKHKNFPQLFFHEMTAQLERVRLKSFKSR